MEYDIAVIGGGPAGMMSAIEAGARGSRVVLLEKNNRLGIKLLITGGGRCNITNVTDEPRQMSKKYGQNGKFFLSSLTRFGPGDAIRFFENEGVEIKTEASGRVFPASNISLDVLKALTDAMEKNNVEIRYGSKVEKIINNGNKVIKAVLSDGEEIIADKFIVATGGKSYPMTGSAGDGYGWLKKLGHFVVDLAPALCAVTVKEKFIADLQGLSLKDVKISVYKNGKKIDEVRGEALFTHEGMSGPAVHDISKMIGENIPGASLKLDFFPDANLQELDKIIQRRLDNDGHKMIKNILGNMMSDKIVLIILRLAGVEGEKMASVINKEERKKVVKFLKEFILEVSRLAGFDKAVITSGGVNLKEVDPKTMKSKLIDNLYFAGEILDLDGPTGGYNLQVCWSTGFVAGESAGKGF